MKYIGFIIALVLIAPVAYGATKLIKKDILEKENVATIYAKNQEVSIYKYIDGTVTCFVATTNKSVMVEMSCVK